MKPITILLTLLTTASALPSIPWAVHRREMLQLQGVNDTITPAETPQLQADSLIKLMFANLDHGDVRSVAQLLLPQYTQLCLVDCEELHSAIRHLYITRYSELQLELHRMDKLGLLLRQIQYLVAQGSLAEPHHRRRDAPALKRVDDLWQWRKKHEDE